MIVVKKHVPDLETHNLVNLANALGLGLSREENKALVVLTDYILWVGKYPIPKKAKQLQHHRTMVQVQEERKIKLGDLDATVSNGILDFDNLKLLWQKLSAQLPANSH